MAETADPAPSVPTALVADGFVGTVASLADVTRRLELRGYSHVKASSNLGMQFIKYEKKTTDADYRASIIRWIGDPRLNTVSFTVETNKSTFLSPDARHEINCSLDEDALAMLDSSAAPDYQRAIGGAISTGDPSARISEGRATTADGWQVDVRIYQRFYDVPRHREGNNIPLGRVVLTHVETNEDVPASSQQALDRQLSELKRR